MPVLPRSRRVAALLCAVLALAPALPVAAQRQSRPVERTDAALQAKVEAAVAGFRGVVGVYARHLKTGRTVALRADDTFPTASLIKVPLLVALYDAVERGDLDLHQPLTWADSLKYPGEDILGSFRDGETVALSKVAMLMITTSDNTGALWIQQLVGTGTRVNAWLEANGFQVTRVNSRTPGREQERSRWGWGQTTPREMAELVVRIRQGKAVSPAADEEMYRALTRVYWNGEALSALPPWVQAASKQGAVDRSRSEVVLVNAPSGDYVFAVITKEQADTTYEEHNEGFVLLRTLSGIFWNHFEPKHPWSPAAGAARLKP